MSWWYYPGYGYPGYMLPYMDPLYLMYTWSYLWMYWISMMYYIEMFRTMMDVWRKMAETTLKPPTTPSA